MKHPMLMKSCSLNCIKLVCKVKILNKIINFNDMINFLQFLLNSKVPRQNKTTRRLGLIKTIDDCLFQRFVDETVFTKYGKLKFLNIH